jgi:predicted ester cyclase
MQSARTVVERYVADVLGGARPEAAAELVADDTLLRRGALFRAAFPDVGISTKLVVSDREAVGVTLSARGTHTGPFQGVAPTGRSWSATCSALYRVVDGRIVDHWVNWDLLAILEQIGAVRRIGESGR